MQPARRVDYLATSSWRLGHDSAPPVPTNAAAGTASARVRAIAVPSFNALSAVGGGIGMVVAEGLSMPKSLLVDSPFSTFLVPGLILLLLVGGTQCAASYLLLRRRTSALLWSAVAGFGMQIWILAEIAMIHTFAWAQLVYVVSGLLQLILVFAQLGIVSWLPRSCVAIRARHEPS